MHQEAIDTLALFVEKVERLLSLSIVKTLVDPGSRLNFSWTADSGVLALAATGPKPEQIDAFVLTMRLFMQDNDRISIRRTAELYDSLPLSADLRRYFAMHRTNLNEALDRNCMLVVDGVRITRREVLETVLYGQLSHLEPNHRQQYLAWQNMPFVGNIIQFEFVGVLSLFLRTLAVMAEISRRAIGELRAGAVDGVRAE